MKEFTLPNLDDEKSVLRTFRVKTSDLKTIEALSRKSGLSVNRIFNECVSYALKNLPQGYLEELGKEETESKDKVSE